MTVRRTVHNCLYHDGTIAATETDLSNERDQTSEGISSTNCLTTYRISAVYYNANNVSHKDTRYTQVPIYTVGLL